MKKNQTSPPLSEHDVHPVYRPDIDGLRAVAILSVVIFHAFPTRLQGGFVGVDIFFVISGFLISTIIFRSMQRGDFSFMEFYAHRVKRIFPALIVVLLTSYIFGWFALLPEEFKQLGKHIAAGAGFVQNLVLWQEAGYFDTASELKPLMHLWSLAIEEQFYLIYPLMIWAVWRFRLNVLTLVLIFGGVSFSLNIYDIGVDAVKTFFVPQTRFWELLAGSVLAYLQFFKRIPFADWMKRGFFHPLIFRHPPLGVCRDAVLNDVLSFLGSALIVFAIFSVNKGELFPGWWALAPVGGAFLLILAGPEAWINRKILTNRLMVFVGLISYPLYLWHWPILSYAHILESELPSREIRIVAVALSFFLAWLTYWMIEKPVRFGRKTWIKTATLCTLTTAIGFIGYNTYQRDGSPFRLHEFLKNNSQFDWTGNAINDECKHAYPDIVLADYCIKSKPLDPTVVVIGDSHSNSLYPGLAQLSKNNTSVILNLAHSACLPFFDVASHPKDQNDVCSAYMNKALQFVENSPTVRTVVLASRWPLAVLGSGYHEGNGPVYNNRQLALISNPEISDFGKVFEIGMRSTLAKLSNKNKEIIFVLSVPELGFTPRSCLDSRPLRITSRIKNPCAVSREEFDKRNKQYRTIALDVLKDFPSVKVADPMDLFCDNQFCWALKDGKMMYRDDDHLSKQGSLFMADKILSLLETF